jgi:hypothetical protein
VPVSEDCERTAGAPARAAEGPQIFTCASAVEVIEAEVPNASSFFLVHEYGHVAIEGPTESQADCWAATELGAISEAMIYVDAAARWLEAHGDGQLDQFGSGAERAQRIRECSGLSFPAPVVSDTCCATGRTCPLPAGANLAVGTGCYCDAEDPEGGFESGEVCQLA